MLARTILSALALATPAFASAMLATGKLDVLPQGRYLCELPGDATGPASRPVSGAWFDIVNSSSYAAESGGGIYLMTGKVIAFTRGPMNGARFERTGPKALRRTDLTGELAALRCVRSSRVPE